MGFESKLDFAPPTVLLGLLLCPRTWDISSKSLQHHAATAPPQVNNFLKYDIYIQAQEENKDV